MKSPRPRGLIALVLTVASAPFSPAAPGDVDLSFTPGAGGETDTIALQPDGKLVVAGNFFSMGGVSRRHVARILADGSLDSTFNPNANAFVRNLALQTDGKVLITGLFTTIGGTTRNYAARVNPDGTLDAAFNPNANNDTYSAAIQPDGKIIMGGLFTSMGSVPRSFISRFLPGGALDTAFNPGADANVRTPLILPDGKILLGGNFVTVAGGMRGRVARLMADGTLDQSFNAAVDGPVYCTALQSDGKILIGGSFSSVGAVSRLNLARLNADGSLDSSFNAAADDIVRTIAVQTDGKIIVGGQFHTLGGTARTRLARLLPAGAIDASFTPVEFSGGTVFGATLQADGRVVVAGLFTSAGSASIPYLVRLQNDSATQSLSVEGGSRIVWMRGGASPETSFVTFEHSPPGEETWTLLGTASRIPGGWELNGLSLLGGGQIRARARISGGYGGASSGLVEAATSYTFDPILAWRQTHFGTPDNSGDAANSADPDHDGLENLIEFAFGLDPGKADSTALPAWNVEDDDCFLNFTAPDNVSGITYIVEQSSTLARGSWTAVPDTATPPHHSYDLPATQGIRRYLRIRVTVP